MSPDRKIFSDLELFRQVEAVSLNSADLVRSVRQVTPCSGRENERVLGSYRAVYGAVRLSRVDSNGLTITAGDGFRVASKVIGAQRAEAGNVDCSVYVSSLRLKRMVYGVTTGSEVVSAYVQPDLGLLFSSDNGAYAFVPNLTGLAEMAEAFDLIDAHIAKIVENDIQPDLTIDPYRFVREVRKHPEAGWRGGFFVTLRNGAEEGSIALVPTTENATTDINLSTHSIEGRLPEGLRVWSKFLRDAVNPSYGDTLYMKVGNPLPSFLSITDRTKSFVYMAKMD